MKTLAKTDFGDFLVYKDPAWDTMYSKGRGQNGDVPLPFYMTAERISDGRSEPWLVSRDGVRLRWVRTRDDAVAMLDGMAALEGY